MDAQEWEALMDEWADAPVIAAQRAFNLFNGSGPEWEDLHETARDLWRGLVADVLFVAKTRGPSPSGLTGSGFSASL